MISGNNIIKIFFVIALVVYTLLLNVRWLHEPHNDNINPQKHTLLTPSVVNNISLGYQYAWAQLLWIDAIAYFGEHLNNSDFPYLASRLSLITSLNPKSEHAYYMAAAVLPWNTQSNKLSEPLLKLAMKTFPTHWLWPYYLGFNAYWFDHDTKKAAYYLLKSAALPDVHYVVSNLAIRMQSQSGQFEVAIEFLDHQIKAADDPNLKKQLVTQKNTLLTEEVLQKIDGLLNNLHTPPFRARDLNTLKKKHHHIPNILPDGGHIMLTNDGGIISSHSQKRYKVFVPQSRKGSL